MAGGKVHRSGRLRGPWVDFRLGYQPAFDGLRGIGVTIIVLYHGAILYQGQTHPSLLPGAQMWLELFFVQSGFLITSFVLEEWHRTGEVRLRRFYLRRAARLAPALLAVAAFSAVALLTFSAFKGLDQPWWELGAAVAYVENWVAAFGVTDYPFYMGHTWSLGIEQQFYLVAPLLVLLLVAGSRSLRRPVPLLVAGSAASAVWMAVLASRTVEAVELQRPYYGTDTRAQGLLIGVALAFALHSGLWLRWHPRPGRGGRDLGPPRAGRHGVGGLQRRHPREGPVLRHVPALRGGGRRNPQRGHRPPAGAHGPQPLVAAVPVDGSTRPTGCTCGTGRS